MGCPQTEKEFQDYFFELIGQNLNGVADNYKYILSQQYNWNGRMMRIPENTPGPNQQLPSDAPFYGLTQQTSGGIPKGRIWIPAAIPDSNGYYTRYIQYIADLPNGQHGVNFIWDWRWQDGNAYVPICGSVTPVPPIPPTPPNNDLEKQVAELTLRLAKLEKTLAGEFGIRCKENNKFLAVEVTWDERVVGNRDNLGPWEKYYLVPVE